MLQNKVIVCPSVNRMSGGRPRTRGRQRVDQELEALNVCDRFMKGKKWTPCGPRPAVKLASVAWNGVRERETQIQLRERSEPEQNRQACCPLESADFQGLFGVHKDRRLSRWLLFPIHLCFHPRISYVVYSLFQVPNRHSESSKTFRSKLSPVDKLYAHLGFLAQTKPV
jgi:hypothetical protein